MNASSKPFALSFSTSIFAFSCFLEAKTWIVYAESSVVAANGFVTTGSVTALGISGVSTMEVSDLGTAGVFGGHTSFGDARRFWDFRSVGRGDIDFEEVIVALNDINYQGPLSVEWEDSRMDRVHGATESAAFLRELDFEPSDIAFDAAFEE